MGIVPRHYNKEEFAIKRIERDGKFKSIIYEVIYEMGIETNNTNSYDHVTEAERNRRIDIN